MVGRAFGGEREGKEMVELHRDLKGGLNLGKKSRFLGREERLGRREGRRREEDGDAGGDFRKAMGRPGVRRKLGF